MLNKVILMGRLTREPELRMTPQNVPVCTITLAVDRDYTRQGEQREADFIDVVCWRHTAEFVSRYFRKGLLVACEGRLQTRKWKDKFEQTRVAFEVIADSMYFAERSDSGQARQDTPAPTYAPPAATGRPRFDGTGAYNKQPNISADNPAETGRPMFAPGGDTNYHANRSVANNQPQFGFYNGEKPDYLPKSDFSELDDDDDVPF